MLNMTDNVHPYQMLDEINQTIQAGLAQKRLALIEKGIPLIGDYVLWPNGEKRRFSEEWADSYQTSKCGSFFAFSDGDAEFSGGLQPGVLTEFLEKTEQVENGSFWFFSHNRVGAGRRADCQLPCRVWKLNAFSRTREEAEKHPKVVRAKNVWGENTSPYLQILDEVMNPKVLTNPNYY